MGSLNNPAMEAVAQPDPLPVVEEVIIPPPPPKEKTAFQKQIGKVVDSFFAISHVKKIIDKRTAKKIEAGILPRGRTDMNELPAIAGEISGVIGGQVLKPQTLLKVRHFTADGQEVGGNYREIHNKVITNAGRDAIVDAFTGAFTLADFKYHHCGTGTGNEAATDIALGTPVAEGRATGTQTQPSSDVYQSVGTITFSNSYAITEHGLLSASTSGTLLDRTKFAAINVVSGDKIEFTFTLTFASGG